MHVISPMNRLIHNRSRQWLAAIMLKIPYRLRKCTNRATLVLAMLLMTIWGSFPSTACVCADGTFKPFCSGICSGTKCCCHTEDRTCSGHSCCHGVCQEENNSHSDSPLLIGEQYSKSCGCHRVAKDQGTLVSRASGEQDDTQSAAVCLAPIENLFAANLTQNPIWCRSISARPPDDIIILFRHLVI